MFAYINPFIMLVAFGVFATLAVICVVELSMFLLSCQCYFSVFTDLSLC